MTREGRATRRAARIAERLARPREATDTTTRTERMNMRSQTMAAAFESVHTAHANSLNSGNGEWVRRWRHRLVKLIELIPSGSGIDRGPRGFDDVQITPDAIRFEIGYHHMNDGGYYDGWTEHTITVRPAFEGVNVRVSGRDRNQVKDYIHDEMTLAFTRHVAWDEPGQRWIVESDNDRYAALLRAYPDHHPNTEEL